jgi:hypothetical protein
MTFFIGKSAFSLGQAEGACVEMIWKKIGKRKVPQKI